MHSSFQNFNYSNSNCNLVNKISPSLYQNKQDSNHIFTSYHLKQIINQEIILNETQSMWRYFPLLPIHKFENIISINEGYSPLIEIPNLIHQGNETNVFWKDDSKNPTNSFNARTISASLSKAKELGIQDIYIACSGKIGGVIAAYAAKGKMKANIFMPKNTSKIYKDECSFKGANLIEVNQNLAKCKQLAHYQSLRAGHLNKTDLKGNYWIEGVKTIGYEIAEQFNWELPEKILFPISGNMALIGIWKAFDELEKLGLIDSHRPIMLAVQTYNSKKSYLPLFKKSNYQVQHNSILFQQTNIFNNIQRILRESRATTINLSEIQIESSRKEIEKNQTLSLTSQAAQLWEAYHQLINFNCIKPNEKVLLYNTGDNLNYS